MADTNAAGSGPMLQGDALRRAAGQTEAARNIVVDALRQIEVLARLLRDRPADSSGRAGVTRDAALVLTAIARLAAEAQNDVDACLSDSLGELVDLRMSIGGAA